MSDLGDAIIEHGPFTEPLRLDGFGYDDGLTDYRKLNELRDELIALRRLVGGKCCGFGARAYVPEVHVFGGEGGCCR